MLDCLKPISHKKLIEHELEGFGIRLNKQPPGITFRRKEKGGISFTTTLSNPRLDLDSETLHPYLLVHLPLLYVLCFASLRSQLRKRPSLPDANRLLDSKKQD